jgi:CheY-like chemotaxis protein
MLVDDDARFRRSLAIRLEVMGFQVTETGSGIEALTRIGSGRHRNVDFDTVIVDARMPGMDGFLVADQIRALHPGMRVILLTGHAFPDSESRYTLLHKTGDINKLIGILKDGK